MDARMDGLCRLLRNDVHIHRLMVMLTGWSVESMWTGDSQVNEVVKVWQDGEQS